MMFRILFLSVFVFSLASSTLFAQDTQRNKSKDSWEEVRERAIDKEIEELMSKRDNLINEEMYKISHKKNKRTIPFNYTVNNFTQTRKIKGRDEVPKFLSIRNTRNAVNLYFESEVEKRKIASSNVPTHRNRSLFEETLETDFKGSLYHPNLATFDIHLENGLNQNREKFLPNLRGKLKNSPLNYFHILFSFLNKKPYAFSLFADKSREVQNREFFERQVINSDRYGGNFRFKNEILPMGFSFSNSEKKIDRVSRPSQNFRDDELSFNVSNESNLFGETFFDANQDTFSRTEFGTPDQNGTSRNFNLTNKKYLSEDEKKLLYSSLRFYDLTGTSKSSILNLNENLDIKHTDYLDTTYTYNFSDRSFSGVNSRDNRISASLRHRLYESLTSTFTPYYFNSDATTFSQDSYGVSWDEDYVKKLGKIGKLNLGTALNYSEEKRKAPKNIISIIDEPHMLSSGIVTFLDKTNVITSTVVVTNSSGTVTFVLDLDYQLIPAGERTQIQRIPTGSISNGQEILADYQANSNPSLVFNTLDNNFRFRMDFLDQLIGVYYRLDKLSHPKVSGEENVVLESLNYTIIGIDLNYKNLTIGFSDEDYDSSLSPYTQQRLKETFFFNPTEKSTLTFTSSQSIVRLINTQHTQKFFDFISRYSIGLNRYSRLYMEGGFRWQQGTGINLNDITAGSGYELNLGKLFMNIRYDFKRQFYLSDKWINHFLSILIKRTF